MTPGRLSDLEGQVRRSWQEFGEAWQCYGASWHDRRREQFERDHLDPLPAVVHRSLAAISELRETLLEVSRDLADPHPPLG